MCGPEQKKQTSGLTKLPLWDLSLDNLYDFEEWETLICGDDEATPTAFKAATLPTRKAFNISYFGREVIAPKLSSQDLQEEVSKRWASM